MVVKKRLGALLCALALCLTLLPPTASAAEVCFTALDITIPPLTSDSMPLWSGGVLYVPASVFDSGSNGGVDLGINCAQSKSNGTVSLFSLRQLLVFDLNSGTCINQQTGALLAGRAIIRNGRIYVPLNTVRDFFDLSTSYLHTDYGYLVRIRTQASAQDPRSMTDDFFVDAASNLLRTRLQEYNQSLIPPESPEVPAVTTPTPAVTPVDTEPDPLAVPTYLAFRCQEGEALDDILTTLQNSSQLGVFFFTPEEIVRQSDTVRRLLGTGHSVGLLIQGRDPEGQLAAGNQALEAAAHSRTRYVYCPEGQREALEAQGWVCWDETVDGVPSGEQPAASYAYDVLRRLDRSNRAAACLTLDDSQATADALPTLLRQLSYGKYTVSVPMETRL